MNDDKERCEKCRFWEDIGESGDGEARLGTCHRFPPTLLGSEKEVHYQPVTYNLDWCGEWQAALPVKRKKK